jgi:hypothetical protein
MRDLGGQCPQCQTQNSEQALMCSLCGAVLKRVHSAVPTQSVNTDEDPQFGPTPVQSETATGAFVYQAWMDPIYKAQASKRSPFFHLGWGLVLAGVFSLPFFLFKTIGWVFESVVHEMGHTLMAYFMGSIALPAIRLDGHAATVSLEQSPILAGIVWLLLVLGAVWFGIFKHRPLLITMVVLALLYPFFAFSDRKEWLLLIAGHGGEMVIATIFLWRSMVPTYKVQEEERMLYAALGWYLWFQNLIMNWNLVYSQESRDWYAENGSFGLENDFMRIADMFGWSLPFLSGVMLLLFLAVPPLGLIWARWSILHRPDATDSH